VIKDKIILLTDDVLTTGNTMNECARMLSLAGAREIIALTIVRV
jgi:predicted amidophosphoribosyltransferase